MQHRIDQRIADNVALVDATFAGDDRLAARHLFSSLRHLEQLAVIAAEKGDAIEGQLEDEYVHRGTFERLADANGGCVPACPEVQRLVDYLAAREGDLSLALLNVTAESWLETVFDCIADWPALDCRALFESIEADEERHVHDALDMARPDPADAEPCLRELEAMLYDIAWSPAFMLPLLYFGGEAAVADMGLALCAAHERASRHLGVTPQTRRLRLLCRAQRRNARHVPQPVDMHAGQVNMMRLYPDLAPMVLGYEQRLATSNGARIQAQVASALASLLARNPELRQVTRRGRIYQADDPLVAVRVEHGEGCPANVVVAGGELRPWREVLMQINRRTRRLRGQRYRVIPAMPDGIDRLLPPSPVCAAVNYNGGHGGQWGYGPLSEIEGIPILVTIGEPRVDGDAYVATITVVVDHRVSDGRRIGLLRWELVDELDRLVSDAQAVPA